MRAGLGGDGMNALDFVILIFVGVIVGTGFFLGVGRVTTGMVAIYFASVVSATFYRSIAESLQGVVTRMSLPTAELISFVFLFLGLTGLFFGVISHSVHSANVELRFGLLNNIG